MGRLVFALVRVGLATGAGLVMLAIAIGRQHRETWPPDRREAAAPCYQPLSGHLFEDLAPGLRLLDLETGELERVRLPGGGEVEHAAVSPWRDGRGRTHLAGLWTVARGRREGDPATALARFAMPGWEVLDRVEVDVAPASPPCWFPDGTSRIVYASWDGRLYHFSFDEPGDGPRPVAWRVRPPQGFLMLATPNRPADPRLAGTLLASLCLCAGKPRPGPRGGPAWQEQLWWLRLSADHSAIEEAGPLTRPPDNASPAPLVEEHYPTVARGTDGGLVLAYLVRRQSDPGYLLRLAPLAIDGDGRPRVEATGTIELPGERIHASPAFSADGRWVHATLRATRGTGQAERVPVAEALGRRSTGPSPAVAMIPEAGPPGDESRGGDRHASGD